MRERSGRGIPVSETGPFFTEPWPLAPEEPKTSGLADSLTVDSEAYLRIIIREEVAAAFERFFQPLRADHRPSVSDLCAYWGVDESKLETPTVARRPGRLRWHGIENEALALEASGESRRRACEVVAEKQGVSAKTLRNRLALRYGGTAS